MQENERLKMCNGCEGRIPLEASSCPYCGAQWEEKLRHASSGPQPLFKAQTLQESLASLYNPPYSSAPPTPEQRREALERTLYPQDGHAAALGEQVIEESGVLWPTLLLSLGAQLLCVGLLQLLLSERGVLRLEWNSHYWFLFCLLALPLLVFGYKKASG